MKKLFAVVTIAAMAMSMAACDQIAGATSASDAQGSAVVSGEDEGTKDAPSADEIYTKIVEPIVGYGAGAAGNSLKNADMASQILQFVKDNDLVNVNKSQLASNTIEAIGRLSATDKMIFANNILGIKSIIDGVIKDPSTIASVFDDVGKTEQVTDLLNSDVVKDGWNKLSDVFTSSTEGIQIDPSVIGG
ncbi:hypothetical protein SAMN02910456_00914 [Ruminococcaceae bacterium YRB3002]|nr:hypothetical protein SAMN02910456_00914 [Ruminococcaceae bacterium YRB3002]